MPLSLGDIAKNKKTESPSEAKREFSFQAKPKKSVQPEVPVKTKSKTKISKHKVDLQKPWEAHRIQPKAETTQDKKSHTAEQSNLNFNNLEQLFSFKKVEEWASQIEVSPKIKIPVPSFFTIKSDD